MYFANPWGLIALASLPVIAAIHLYHRRYPKLEIAGLHLWGADVETRSPGRRRDRLPITSTLLLELLAALLLSLVLSQPRWNDSSTVEHWVVVLDNSASMSARLENGRALRDLAADELEKELAALPRKAVVSLIVTGRRPVLIAGPAVEWDEAQAALAEWRPALPRHDFQPAWDLAAQLADTTGKLLFLTDRLPDGDVTTPEQLRVVSVGRGLENVAITAARWTFDSTTNTGSVYLRLRHFGRRAVEARLEGRTPAQLLFERTVSLAPDAETPLEVEVPGGLGELNITVRARGDALDVDSAVTLIEPKVRLVTLAVTLPADDAATRAVERALAGVPDLQRGEPEKAQLIIGPAGELPPSRADLWWLGIGPIDRSDEGRGKARDLVGPYLIEKQNPLLDSVVLGGVIWGGAQPVNLALTPLVSAGRTPLLGRLHGTETVAYLLNVDLGRPNFTESPDWPILIKNLIDLRRDSLPGLRQWNYRLDEEICFALPAGAEGTASSRELSLLHGERSRPLARSSPVELPPLEETGVFEVRDGEALVGRFAVNFHDADESSLVELAPGVRAAPRPDQGSLYRVDNPYSWLLMAGMACVLLAVILDWKVLQPRKAAVR